MTETERTDRTIKETIEVAGKDAIEKVKSLFKEGNVRQLKLKAEDGDFALEVPMTIGVIAGGAVALTAPWLAILGVIAAVVAKVRIEVERDEDPAAQPEAPAVAPPAEALPPAGSA